MLIPSSGQNGLSRFVSFRTPRAALQLRLHRDAFCDDVLRRLVVTQTDIDGCAEAAVLRPLGELDLGDERRLDPGHVLTTDAWQPRHLVER